MSECEQEETFVRVAERILERSEMPAPASATLPSPETTLAESRGENFTDLTTWMRLVKIGQWVIDDGNRRIIGAAPHTYLLSRHEYGQKPFEIRAALQFSQFEQHISQPINKMNAGIVLGWNKDKDNPRYYNILISGVDVVIERIGFNGGTVVRDYEHVTDAVPLRIQGGTTYEFHVTASAASVRVSVTGRDLLTLENLVGLQGRVGLRPWRSQLACTAFQVKELNEPLRADNVGTRSC